MSLADGQSRECITRHISKSEFCPLCGQNSIAAARLRMGTLFLQHGAAVFPCPTDYIAEFCLIAFRAAALKPREVVKVNAECD